MATISTLDDLTALNDQLAALVEAGVPIDVGLEELGQDAAGSLARRVARGESLAEAIESNENGVPVTYRSMVLRGLRSGDLNAALDGASRLANRVDDLRHVVRSAFAYPVILCALAYAGTIGFCLFFVPTLESTHENLRIPAGSGLRLLQSVRDTLPYWVAIPPVALLVFVEWQRRTRSRGRFSVRRITSILPWRRGERRALFLLQCATFAETLAALTDRKVPLGEGLSIASGACGNASLAEAAHAIAASLEHGQSSPSDSRAAMRFPPFLRWVLLHSEESIGRSRALWMAADIYRKAAERRAERLRIVAPIVTCAVLGGGVTLLYGLALFVPVVQMLHALAQ